MMFSVYICFVFLLLVSSLLFYSQQQMDNGERQKIKSDSLLCITTTDSHEQHMAEQHGAMVWQWAPELKEQVAAVLTTTLMPGRLRYRGEHRYLERLLRNGARDRKETICCRYWYLMKVEGPQNCRWKDSQIFCHLSVSCCVKSCQLRGRKCADGGTGTYDESQMGELY